MSFWGSVVSSNQSRVFLLDVLDLLAVVASKCLSVLKPNLSSEKVFMSCWDGDDGPVSLFGSVLSSEEVCRRCITGEFISLSIKESLYGRGFSSASLLEAFSCPKDVFLILNGVCNGSQSLDAVVVSL